MFGAETGGLPGVGRREVPAAAALKNATTTTISQRFLIQAGLKGNVRPDKVPLGKAENPKYTGSIIRLSGSRRRRKPPHPVNPAAAAFTTPTEKQLDPACCAGF